VLYPASSLGLSQTLKINQRTVQRWIAGAMWPPADVWQAVAGLLRVRGRECAKLEREITAACAATGPSTSAQERPDNREEE
jgi:hypothetical protein